MAEPAYIVESAKLPDGGYCHGITGPRSTIFFKFHGERDEGRQWCDALNEAHELGRKRGDEDARCGKAR